MDFCLFLDLDVLMLYLIVILSSSIFGYFKLSYCYFLLLFFCFQRQLERIKRDKAHTRRGDDAEPQVQPGSLVPVSRYHGSRLASAPTPSPYQQTGRSHESNGFKSARNQVGHATMEFSGLEIKGKPSRNNKEASERPSKAARLSSGATIGAAIVEAENSLEIDVCFPTSGEAF